MDFKNMFKMEDVTEKFDEKDINDSKVLSLFSYLGILILIPILACKDSKFAKFHANQGLKLIILSFVMGLVAGLLSFVLNIFLIILGAMDMPIITIFFSLIMIVIGLVCMVLGIGLSVIEILGIVYAVTGKAKKLPVLNVIKYDFIKYE